MSDFLLCCTVTVSAHTKVEAESLCEAKELARAREVVLGGINSGASTSENWVIEEADGIATNIYRVG